jgi:hypothetical protein
LLFPGTDETSVSAADPVAGSLLRLVVPRRDGTVSVARTFEWQLPIDLDQVGKETS